jgi:hypothetical protein
MEYLDNVDLPVKMGYVDMAFELDREREYEH